MTVEVRGLVVSAGRTEILKKMNLTLESGQFTGILGPSGSGKSTLLTTLAGRRPATAGNVLYDGQGLSGRPGISVGFVPQDDTLHLPLKTERLLYYYARLQDPKQPDKALWTKVRETLKSVDLQERAKLPVKKLSGGQRKRVSIAMELLSSPKVLMLDEPTSGLDPELEKSIMKLCARLAQEGRTVVMTTHILDSIGLFDQLIFLVEGHLAFQGPPQEALSFFQAQSMHHIYATLASTKGETLATRFRANRKKTTNP